MKLLAQYKSKIVIFCLIVLFIFHFCKVMFASTYAEFGYNRIRIESSKENNERSIRNETSVADDLDKDKDNNDEDEELLQDKVENNGESKTNEITKEEYTPQITDIEKDKGDTACKIFLRKSLNVTIDDSLMLDIWSKCVPNNTGTEDYYKLLNVNFFRKNIGNMSCERKKPAFLTSAKPLVALASFQGSGNTWTREMLEQITGVYTGSIYPDRMSFFAGSKYCPSDGKVFIVKTHSRDKQAIRKGCTTVEFSKAIYILRNPYDSIMAEFNRHTSGKITFATPKDFRSKKWKKFVKNNYRYWRDMTMFWLTQFNKPMHLLVYEHLQTNPVFEIFKLMKFMRVPLQLRSIYCFSTNNFETYYRKNKPEWLHKEFLYHHQSRNILNSAINYVIEAVKNDSYIVDVLKSYILEV